MDNGSYMLMMCSQHNRCTHIASKANRDIRFKFINDPAGFTVTVHHQQQCPALVEDISCQSAGMQTLKGVTMGRYFTGLHSIIISHKQYLNIPIALFCGIRQRQGRIDMTSGPSSGNQHSHVITPCFLLYHRKTCYCAVNFMFFSFHLRCSSRAPYCPS